MTVMLDSRGLLRDIVRSLPRRIGDIGVAVNCPLRRAPFCDLVRRLVRLRKVNRPRRDRACHLRCILATLHRPCAEFVDSQCASLLRGLRRRGHFCPSHSFLDVSKSRKLSLLFEGLRGRATRTARDDCGGRLVDCLLSVLHVVKARTGSLGSPLFRRSLCHACALLGHLRRLVASNSLRMSAVALRQLVRRLVRAADVPFRNRPTRKVRMVNMLRAEGLSFSRVLILSYGRNGVPGNIGSSSFVPCSLHGTCNLAAMRGGMTVFTCCFRDVLRHTRSVALACGGTARSNRSNRVDEFVLRLVMRDRRPVIHGALVTNRGPLHPTCSRRPGARRIVGMLSSMEVLAPAFLGACREYRGRFCCGCMGKLLRPSRVSRSRMSGHVFKGVFRQTTRLFCCNFTDGDSVRASRGKGRRLVHPVIVATSVLSRTVGSGVLMSELMSRTFERRLFGMNGGSCRPGCGNLRLVGGRMVTDCLQRLVSVSEHRAPFAVVNVRLMISSALGIGADENRGRFGVNNFVSHLSTVSPVSGVSRHVEIVSCGAKETRAARPGSVSRVFSTAPRTLDGRASCCLRTFLCSVVVGGDGECGSTRSPMSPNLLFVRGTNTRSCSPALGLNERGVRSVAPCRRSFVTRLHDLVTSVCGPTLPLHPACSGGHYRCYPCTKLYG